MIPAFVPNSSDDTHCVNAVFRMLYKTFLGRDISWEEIDARTKAQPGKGTWTIGGDILLAKAGISVVNIEPVDYQELFRIGTKYLSDVFGTETAEYYRTRSNIEAVLPDIPEFLSVVRHETRKATTDEILGYLREGKFVGATLNSSILNAKPGFSLHYVLLYDTNGVEITLHDPGLPPAPGRKITREQLEKSFFYPGGNGGIEVFYEG